MKISRSLRPLDVVTGLVSGSFAATFFVLAGMVAGG